jgi:outer membrane protein assembly factor BamB
MTGQGKEAMERLSKPSRRDLFTIPRVRLRTGVEKACAGKCADLDSVTLQAVEPIISRGLQLTQNAPHALPGTLDSLTSKTGAAVVLNESLFGDSIAWEFKTGGAIESSPAMDRDGTVYIGSNDHRLYAVKNGKELWKFETGHCIYSSPCPGPDGTVYAGSRDGKLYALKEGENLWEFKTGNQIEASPCLGPDGIVYVGSWDGSLYAVRNGEKVWEFKSGQGIYSSPCIGPGGMLYLGSWDGTLYAIKNGESA